MLSNSRFVTVFNLPLAVVAGWLLWRSLDWPLVGDATIFHFIASQFQMGAIQYRDIFDINMPLIYFVHAAVIAIGGMGDGAWRAFDLIAAVLMSGLILVLVWPAGRAVAILAVLIVLVTHFLLGPYSAGQRDFLMSIPALAAALASAKAAEDHQHDRFYLVLVGVFAMTAASIKPSGMLLLLLPVFTRVKRDWRELQWVIIGAAGTGILVFGTLAAWGGLEPFITTMQGLMPRYASLGARTVLEISEDVVVWLAPTAGLALAAVLNISAPKPQRVRAMIGLTLFGLIHLLVQRKGWFYHVYPLGIGLACWGAWSLASLARGCMPDGHGHYAGLAGAGGGADTNKDVSGAAFRFGHAGCARRPIAAWRARSNARFGLWSLPGHGARRNATGHAAYPMVLSYLCRGSRPARLPCRARGRSAGRCPLDQLPMAAAGRFRCRRLLARACGAVGITICPRPIRK